MIIGSFGRIGPGEPDDLRARDSFTLIRRGCDITMTGARFDAAVSGTPVVVTTGWPTDCGPAGS
jgi:hypothetical protein